MLSEDMRLLGQRQRALILTHRGHRECHSASVPLCPYAPRRVAPRGLDACCTRSEFVSAEERCPWGNPSPGWQRDCSVSQRETWWPQPVRFPDANAALGADPGNESLSLWLPVRKTQRSTDTPLANFFPNSDQTQNKRWKWIKIHQQSQSTEMD